MPGSSNTSFIPKRNPTSGSRQNTKQQVFLGSFVIKILFFASILAAIGVFGYEMKLNKNLESEILNLENSIKSFNVADMERVVEIDKRLSQANQRLQYSASIVSLLGAIEKSTSGSNQITELVLERKDDSTIELEASMKTGTFDSVLFQRAFLEKGEILSISEIDDLTLQNVPPDNGLYVSEYEGTGEEKVTVTFKALLSIDTQNIRHKAVPIDLSSQEEAVTPEVNQENAEVNQEQL
jgi:hypothetical protein